MSVPDHLLEDDDDLAPEYEPVEVDEDSIECPMCVHYNLIQRSVQ